MRRLVLVVFVLMFFAPLNAFACGAFAPEVDTTSDVTLDAQRTVYLLTEERMQISLQVFGSEPTGSFAWVLPIPADETAMVTTGSPELFDQLDEATRPSVEVTRSDDAESGCGCGDAKSLDGGARDDGEGVDVFAAGTAGDYEYTIVGGAEAESILDYLQAEGFAVSGELEGLLQTYVDAQMRFIAVKLTDDAIEGDSFSADPLVIDLERPAELFYPLALSAASAPQETELLIYVIGDDTHVVADALMLKSKDVADELEFSGGTYRSATRQLTFESQGRRFVTDYAGPLSPDECPACELASKRHVTRLYAVFAEDDLVDLTLFGIGEATTVERTHTRTTALEQGPAGLGVALVPLFVLLRRRRRR